MEEPRIQVGAAMSGLDIRYETGGGHPLLGRRMPNVDISTGSGELRFFSLLHGARPVLLNVGKRGRLALGPWADRVTLVDVATVKPWEIPAVGSIAPPGAVLVRPDGHTAWVEQAGDQSLADALEQWFGSPASAENISTALEGAR